MSPAGAFLLILLTCSSVDYTCAFSVARFEDNETCQAVMRLLGPNITDHSETHWQNTTMFCVPTAKPDESDPA